MSDTIKIAVIDDHPLFREGVAFTLDTAGGFEVVGQGSSAADAMRIVTQQRPDMILLDVSMPGSGVEAAKTISTMAPDIRIVMLTVSESEEHVAAALQAGARGYMLKGSSAAELVRTVRAIYEGDSYVSPGLAARLLTQMKQQAAPVADRGDDRVELTSREDEILAFVSRGLTNKEIAARLSLSEKTVKHYMTNIMNKLQVRNRVEAVLASRRRMAS
ncbi:response regulator [Alsobacter sp. R-9]